MVRPDDDSDNFQFELGGFQYRMNAGVLDIDTGEGWSNWEEASTPEMYRLARAYWRKEAQS